MNLIMMATALKEELANVGLSQNAGMTKVLTTVCDINLGSLDIGGEPAVAPNGDMAHKYLGRKLCGNLRSRSSLRLAIGFKQHE